MKMTDFARVFQPIPLRLNYRLISIIRYLQRLFIHKKITPSRLACLCFSKTKFLRRWWQLCNKDKTKVPDYFFPVMFCLTVSLLNSMSKLIHNRWTCKLIVKALRVRLHTCIQMNNCWFSHHVTKFQTSELLILLRFYFHDVLEQLKTNIQTNFHSKWVLGLVIDLNF